MKEQRTKQILICLAASLGCFWLGNRAGLLYVSAVGTVTQLMVATTELFDRIANRNLTVRRITIAANRVVKDQGILQVDLFTDTSKLEREKSLQATMLGIKKKFGKNAVLKGNNYLEGATMRERNGQIGGHKAK